MFKNLRPIVVIQKVLLHKSSARSFCMYTAYLNPEKHIYMNHNPTNVYEDILQIGDYLLPQKLMVKQLSRDYIPQITAKTFETVKKANPAARLDAQNYENFKLYSWKKLGVADFDAVKNEVLERLAREIFVKENKHRYLVEQRQRLAKTNYIFNRVQMHEKSIEYFVEGYNILLRIDIDRSNLWRSPKVQGESSFHEKHEQESSKPVTGIEDLKRDLKENKTLLNRIMAGLHSV